MTITSSGIMSANFPTREALNVAARDRIVDAAGHEASLIIAPLFGVPTLVGDYPVVKGKSLLNTSSDRLTPIAQGAPLSPAKFRVSSRPYSLERWDHGRFDIPTAVALSHAYQGIDPASNITDEMTQAFFDIHEYKVFSFLNTTTNYNGGDADHQYDPGSVTSASFSLPFELQKVRARFRRSRVGKPNVVVIANDVFGYLLQNEFVRNLATVARQDEVAADAAPLEGYLRRFFQEQSLRVVIADGATEDDAGTETPHFTARMAFLRSGPVGTASFVNTIQMERDGIDLFSIRSEYQVSEDAMAYFCDSNWNVEGGTETAGVLWKDLLG